MQASSQAMISTTDATRRQAFVTLCANDGYVLGAIVIAASLRGTGTQRQIVALITDQVSLKSKNLLGRTFDRLVNVERLDSEDARNLAALKRSELGITFTKLHVWALTEYEKCVFLDADTLVLQNVDELFDRPELSAAADAGWPDCFNSGVFVLVPSRETHAKLLAFASEQGSFDGGDQGLLNRFFPSWSVGHSDHRLSFLYNLNVSAHYSYAPAFQEFGHNAKIIHYIGPGKPWRWTRNNAGRVLPREEEPYQHDMVQKWWDVLDAVLPEVDLRDEAVAPSNGFTTRWQDGCAVHESPRGQPPAPAPGRTHQSPQGPHAPQGPQRQLEKEPQRPHMQSPYHEYSQQPPLPANPHALPSHHTYPAQGFSRAGYPNAPFQQPRYDRPPPGPVSQNTYQHGGPGYTRPEYAPYGPYQSVPHPGCGPRPSDFPVVETVEFEAPDEDVEEIVFQTVPPLVASEYAAHASFAPAMAPMAMPFMPMMPMMPMMMAMVPCMPAMMAAVPGAPFALPGMPPQPVREEMQFTPVAHDMPPAMWPDDDELPNSLHHVPAAPQQYHQLPQAQYHPPTSHIPSHFPNAYYDVSRAPGHPPPAFVPATTPHAARVPPQGPANTLARPGSGGPSGGAPYHPSYSEHGNNYPSGYSGPGSSEKHNPLTLSGPGSHNASSSSGPRVMQGGGRRGGAGPGSAYPPLDMRFGGNSEGYIPSTAQQRWRSSEVGSVGPGQGGSAKSEPGGAHGETAGGPSGGSTRVAAVTRGGPSGGTYRSGDDGGAGQGKSGPSGGSAQDRKCAYVTLITNDEYAPGALALGKSLRQTGTPHELMVMVTDKVSQSTRRGLLRIWTRIVTVEEIDSNDTTNLQLLERPELGITFSKIAAWSLTDYGRCVFLDADTLALQPIDDLFERRSAYPVSAAADCGWPDTFNSGVVLLTPSQKTFSELRHFAATTGSFDGGDQGLLNRFFPRWERLPFTYNVHPGALATRPAALAGADQSTKIVHFLGAHKPWRWGHDGRGQLVAPNAEQEAYRHWVQTWWDVYEACQPC